MRSYLLSVIDKSLEDNEFKKELVFYLYDNNRVSLADIDSDISSLDFKTLIIIDIFNNAGYNVTVEDILEELVGEIRDEFDDDEISDIRKIGEDHYLVYSKVLVDDICKLLYLDIEDPNVDTIGGWYFTNMPDLNIDESFIYENYEMKIHEIDGLQIQFLEIKKLHDINEEKKEE